MLYVHHEHRVVLFIFNKILLLIKKKNEKLSILGVYCGDKNQESKLHRSRKIRKEKQENCDRVSVQTKRVCKKKDLISSKDCSQSSKHLAFLSLQNPNSPHQAMRHKSPKVNIAMSPKFT